MMNTAAIALGGNIGPVQEVFVQTLAMLDQLPEIQLIGRSRYFKTKAMGEQAGGDYVNAVALLQATCSPEELLADLGKVEDAFGRQRDVRWGPRIVDLDILSFGNHRFCLDSLGSETGSGKRSPVRHHPFFDYHGTLLSPHPACWYRRFVLDAWCDVAPHFRHPILQETVRELQARLLTRPLPVHVSGHTPAVFEELKSVITEEGLAVHLLSEEEETQAVISIRFLPDDSDCLLEDNGEETVRMICLPASPAGVQMAVTALKAALDEPVPFAS